MLKAELDDRQVASDPPAQPRILAFICDMAVCTFVAFYMKYVLLWSQMLLKWMQ